MDFTKVKKNLEQNGFAVSVFKTAAEAAQYLDESIDGVTVGMGGSVTLTEMGMCDRLCTHNKLFSHWMIGKGMTREEIMAGAQTADVYLSSVNGLSEDGEIVNIDGNCNRVSGIMFGHKKVYLVVGANKIAPDYEAALSRARNIAAPKNAQRLKRNTPCAQKGDRCYNCNSADRICRGLSVLWKKPTCAEYEIVLVDEELGY